MQIMFMMALNQIPLEATLTVGPESNCTFSVSLPFLHQLQIIVTQITLIL